MDQQTLLIIMAAFVGLAAIAMVIQAGMLIGIYKTARGIEESMSRLTPKIEALIESSSATLESSHKMITEVTTKAHGLLDITQAQIERFDTLFSDASERTHRQMEHAEAMVEDTIERAHRTIVMVHGGVMKPLREINGVTAGLRAALQYLMKGVRNSPERMTVDEEMFI